MATMKDVAKLADVSVTTVSIIINGKAQERKIPQQTCDKVIKAIHALGYQPNLSARRLRTNDTRKPIIAFYWPLDYRTHILASFLNGIQSEIERQNFDCELVIQTYENDYISKNASGIIKNSYNGVIIGAPSDRDLEFLETLAPPMPLVLINRDSKRYSTIYTDTNEVGFTAANLFHQKGYKEVAILSAEKPYLAAELRVKAFLDACFELDIEVKKSCILTGANSIKGGALAAEQYCNLKNPPRGLFCESDFMALGAIHTFKQHGIHIPEDVEIIAIGLLDSESTEYSIPSISVIEMPSSKIAASAVSTIMEALSANDFQAIHTKVDFNVILRESFNQK
ncbi:LacI family DNA-binding transcriptional regulator [Wukongibacter sp. M2B1]|uniref:LacI family DNA-binding transcriptional regulator n=1 Tax=Wukongibacter sp. M2B1 TaxID=3088895 RepID=UPI003D7B44DD